MLNIADLNPACARIAAIDVSFAMVEVVEFDWPNPAEARFTIDRPMLSYWRGQPGYESKGGFGPRMSTAIGPVFFVPSDQEFTSYGTGGPVRAVRCSFDSGYLGGILPPDDQLTQGHLLRGLDVRSPHIRSLLVRLMEEALSPDFASEALAEYLCGALAIEWAREMLQQDEEPHGKLLLTKRQLCVISDRLIDTSQPFPTLMDLARLAGFGDRHLHFCRAFRRQTGETISNKFRSARIEQAQHLLLHTDLELKVIAYRLGFSTSANFSTAFQAAANMPPGAYRRLFYNSKQILKTVAAGA